MKINVTKDLIGRRVFETCRTNDQSSYWNPISIALRQVLLREVILTPEEIRIFFYIETGKTSVSVKAIQAVQEFTLCFNTKLWEMLFPFSFNLDIEEVEKQAREKIHYKT